MASGDANRPDGASTTNSGKEKMVNITKPQIEHEGYQKTITSVVKTRLEENGGDDKTGVSELLAGMDDAIKTCRNLRQRLAKLHQKRRTGHYAVIPPKTAST